MELKTLKITSVLSPGRNSLSRFIAIISPECELQTTLVQLQQLEIESHDSKPTGNESEVL